MGRLYLVPDKSEIDRRKKLVGSSFMVEVWQDLYTEDIFWMRDDETRRIAYGQKRERAPAGLFWVGEDSKAVLDGVGTPLPFILAVVDRAVPIYYGPQLADTDSLPAEESLRARVLSAHGIAVAWATYTPSGERHAYEPTSPTDPMFYLRRPRAPVAHLWRLFRTKQETLTYVTGHLPSDPEALRWARQLPVEDFAALLQHVGQEGS